MQLYLNIALSLFHKGKSVVPRFHEDKRNLIVSDLVQINLVIVITQSCKLCSNSCV